MENINKIKTLVKSLWRLQVLEHQVLGVYVSGAGSKPCTVGGVHDDDRPTM